MTASTDPASRIAELRALFATQMRARGPTLARQVARAGRRLPRRLRAQARWLAQVEPMLANPRTARRIDTEEVARAHAALAAHLRGLDPARARVTALLGILAGLAATVLLIGAGVVTWLVLTGRA